MVLVDPGDAEHDVVRDDYARPVHAVVGAAGETDQHVVDDGLVGTALVVAQDGCLRISGFEDWKLGFRNSQQEGGGEGHEDE